MRMQRPNCLDAEDQKVYTAWLRKTVIAYGTLILIGTAVLAVQATKHTTDVAGFTAEVVTQEAP
jgi:hypothetical protein